MQALDLRDNSLQWETERQNRIHQEAQEQKKKQMRLESARREAPLVDAASPRLAIALEEWIEKVHRIPHMRSALIPPDDELNVEGWSKPFSLCKADMEPWLSFYKGYKQSRLFVEASSANRHAVADGQSELFLDFPVRALLELKQVSPKLISEPPVQIDGQVEYFDLESELRTNADPMRAKVLLKSVGDMHDAELRRAVQKGREMGNLLHDALMGEGHANLINAWVKVRNRKPTVDELHMMLTTGRVKISAERKPQVVETRDRLPEPRSAAPVARIIPERQTEAIAPKDKPLPRDAAMPERKAAPEQNPPMMQEPEKIDHKSKTLSYLFQAVACCATLAALVFLL